MKKSEALKWAAVAVIKTPEIHEYEKVKILRILFREEANALFWEEEELKKQENNE